MFVKDENLKTKSAWCTVRMSALTATVTKNAKMKLPISFNLHLTNTPWMLHGLFPLPGFPKAENKPQVSEEIRDEAMLSITTTG